MKLRTAARSSCRSWYSLPSCVPQLLIRSLRGPYFSARNLPVCQPRSKFLYSPRSQFRGSPVFRLSRVYLACSRGFSRARLGSPQAKSRANQWSSLSQASPRSRYPVNPGRSPSRSRCPAGLSLKASLRSPGASRFSRSQFRSRSQPLPISSSSPR